MATMKADQRPSGRPQESSERRRSRSCAAISARQPAPVLLVVGEEDLLEGRVGELEVDDVWRAIALSTGSMSPVTLKRDAPIAGLQVAHAREARAAPPGRPARRTRPRPGAGVLPSRSATRSTATSRPSRMIPTRSHTRSTSSSSCEERKTAQPRSRSSRTSARNSSCISGSSPLVGSSRISSSGWWKTARIRPTFWRLPRESCPSGRSRSARKRRASASARPSPATPRRRASSESASRPVARLP